MKIIEYYLLPEADYKGKYDRKEGYFIVKTGTVADMIHDSGMFCGYDFDKCIPDFERLNSILMQGYFPRLAEWDSIQIDEAEYKEIVESLLSIPLDKPYRVEV